MKKTVRALCAVAASLAIPTTAHADEDGVKKAAAKLLDFGHAVADARSKGAEVAGHGVYRTEPSKCTEAIAEAVQAGATDSTRLYEFGWPDTLPSYQYESSKGSSITLEAARGVCADYAVWQPLVKAAGAVLASVNRGESPAICIDTIDGLDAASRKLAVKIGDRTMTLDDGRALCQELLDKRAKEAKEQAAADGAKRAAIEAKWKKVGMKGARLALFVENELDGGGFDWYAAGCQTVISDPKKLAKAKKLFTWTAGANGGTLVSKYVFKGNTYKETSREYFDEAKAYRGCK
jgi:hypothetical protein